MALAVLSFLAVLAVANAAKTLGLSARIVNGQNVNLGEIPYAVYFQRQRGDTYFCTGSVIRAKSVLTAAHCVFNTGSTGFTIHAKTVSLTDPGDVHEVEAIYVHENYSATDSFVNDIAIVQVTQPFVPDAQLSFATLPDPDSNVPDYSDAVVSGWGSAYAGGPPSTQLQKADVDIAPQYYCQRAYSLIGNIYDTQICATSSNRRIPMGPCDGDGGGPLTINGTLVGITSWWNFLIGCDNTFYPSVFTRVSSYIDWIDERAV